MKKIFFLITLSIYITTTYAQVPLEYTKDTTYSNAPYRAEVTDLVITLEEKEQNNEEENKQ